MGEKSAWEVLGLIGEDDEIRRFGQRLDDVRYEVHEEYVEVWSLHGKGDRWKVNRNRKTGESGCNCPAWRFPKMIEVKTPAGVEKVREMRMCKHAAALVKFGVLVPYQKPKNVVRGA